MESRAIYTGRAPSNADRLEGQIEIAPSIRRLVFVVLLLSNPVFVLASDGSDGDTEPYAVGFDYSDTRFTIGVAIAALRYDTRVKFVDKSSGASALVDGEDTLGLPESDVSPVLFAGYRFSRKHSVDFSYWDLKRSNFFLDEDIDFGDVEIDGSVEISDRSRFFYLNYSYTFLDEPRSKIFGMLGLYGLDVKYQVDAIGEIVIDGELITGGTYSRTASAFAPLPLVGVDAVFALTPKWSFGTKVMLIGGSVADIRNALVLDTTVRAQYMFNESFGLHFGLKYFNADFDVNKSSVRSEVSYGFDGVFAGLSFAI